MVNWALHLVTFTLLKIVFLAVLFVNKTAITCDWLLDYCHSGDSV